MADIQKVEIDQKAGKLILYYKQNNSHLASNPPPSPSYYREVYNFRDLEFIGREDAKVTSSKETIEWPEQ